MSDADAFEALWQRVLDAWDDDKVHAALMEYATRTEQLAELAGRYRKLTDDPEKTERAKKKLDGVVAAATALLMAMKTPARTKTPWTWNVTVGIVCAAVMMFLAYKILHMPR
jgi:hypothetical protein